MVLPLHGQQTEQAFPRRGTTKNSTQAAPGFLAAALPSQLHLSPDPVALAASLPSPLGAEQSGSPVIPDTTRAEQFHSGLPGGFAAKPCSSRGRGLTWDGGAGDIRYSSPLAVPRDLSASPAQTPALAPTIDSSPPGPTRPPPGHAIALTVQPLLPCSVTYALAVPSSFSFWVTKCSSAVPPSSISTPAFKFH